MEECRITPVELYFLGVLLNAEFIDYEYISSIPEIYDNYRVIEQNTLDHLESKNLIEQDFDGTVTVNAQLEDLLKPVFFGLVECRVITTWSEGNLHVGKGFMTFVSQEHDYFLLEPMNDEKLKELIKDEELELHCMNIEKGYYDMSFSEDEMAQNELVEKAIQIMKGNW